MSALVPPQRSPLPLNEIRDRVLAFFMCVKPRRAGAKSHSARVATKCRGLQTVDLSWTGATSSSIDVYRNGVLIVTVPNNGFYTAQPNGHGHATYIYKVCDAGTGNCSNQVTVNF